MKADWFKVVIAFALLSGLAIYFVNSSSASKRQDAEIQIREREVQVQEKEGTHGMFDKYSR